ncbi:unnamed protein product, partial [Meganyctiphanes norvegica]
FHSVLNNSPDMKIITGIFLLISLGMGQCYCPNSFEAIGQAGCCYYFSVKHDQYETFQEARDYCQELGELLGADVDLAEIGRSGNKCCNDIELLEAMSDKGVSYPWIGATDSSSEGTWRWVHSQEV